MKNITLKKGKLNGMWKGDNVGYDALHAWVKRELGKAFWCTFCFKVGTGKQIQWANISGQYKRDLNDWMQLCAKCHYKFDRGVQATWDKSGNKGCLKCGRSSIKPDKVGICHSCYQKEWRHTHAQG